VIELYLYHLGLFLLGIGESSAAFTSENRLSVRVFHVGDCSEKTLSFAFVSVK